MKLSDWLRYSSYAIGCLHFDEGYEKRREERWCSSLLSPPRSIFTYIDHTMFSIHWRVFYKQPSVQSLGGTVHVFGVLGVAGAGVAGAGVAGRVGGVHTR